MKTINLIIFILTMTSCSNSEDINSEDTKKNNETKTDLEICYEMADMSLKYDSEKIFLISIIKGIPYKKTNSILKEYIAKTDYYEYYKTDKSPQSFIKLVHTISNTNNLSKKLTASIIFSYKYEMITKEEIRSEIEDEVIDEFRSEIEEEIMNDYIDNQYDY